MKPHLFLFSVLGLALGCQAQQSARVLQELRRADADLKHVFYAAKGTLYSPSSSLPRTASYRFLVAGRRFKMFQHESLDGRTVFQQRIVFDGQDKMTYLGKSVTISRGAGDTLSPILALVSLQPGPCLLQGRGLSALKNLRVAPAPSSPLWIAHALAPDGTSITAWLDPQARFLARRIERKSSGLSIRIDTQGKTAGGLLPGRTTMTTLAPFHVKPSVYTFSEAEFPTKKTISFQGTFTTPMAIFDSRLGHTIGISKTTAEPISKEQLLKITYRETQKELEQQQVIEAVNTRQVWMNRSLMSLPVLAAGLILFWRPAKKVAPNV